MKPNVNSHFDGSSNNWQNVNKLIA